MLPVSLSYGQAAILLCLGLQIRDITCISEAIDLLLNQALALFSKAVSVFLSQLEHNDVFEDSENAYCESD